MRNLMETNPKTAMALATIRNCNITLGNMKFLKTPMGRLLQIELQVIFTNFLLLLIVAFGSRRRRSNSKKFQLFIFTAYTLPTYLLTYTLSLMHDAPSRNELFPIWAILLMIAFGSTDSVSAYSLEDNEQWKRNNWQLLTKSIWLVWLMDLYVRDGSKAVVAAECLFIVLAVKFYERARAMMAASRPSLERNTKVVADYMSMKHYSLGEDDPVSMRGCKYLVRGEEERWVNAFARAKRFIKRCLGKEEAVPAPADRMTLEAVPAPADRMTLEAVPAPADRMTLEAVPAPADRMTLDIAKLITIEKVWGCEGRLLSPQGDPHNKLKDICLSFALFKLLRLRYAGYSLPREAHQKTWMLIRDGLLSQDDNYKRAFRVLEAELAFLFDFFYTKYGIIFQLGWLLIKLMELMGILVAIWTMTSLLKHHKRPNSNCRLTTMPNGLSVDVFVTSMMIISFIIMELMQFFFMGFSEWAKVMWICNYVQKKSWQKKVWIERMIRAICRVRLQKPWEQKLRQYSFLESYSYKPSMLLNNAFMSAFIDQTRDGQRLSKPIPLHEEVKQAVFDALLRNNGTKLENGQASLRLNNVYMELWWACQLETQTGVIMVWHIATSFCEHHFLVGSSGSIETRRSFLVATCLSRYLAYLVAFAPRLLPDHHLVAEYAFNRAIIEARDFFQGCKTMEERVNKMKSSEHEETVINRGARLGKQLVNVIADEGMIWKILADFWVELALYVVPSDDAKAHVEHLARGGEFVTHLWALLSHTGIERNPRTRARDELERSEIMYDSCDYSAS